MAGRAVIDAYIDLLRTLIQHGGEPKNSISDRAKIHQNSLNGTKLPDWAPSLHTLRQIEGAVLSDEQRAMLRGMLEAMASPEAIRHHQDRVLQMLEQSSS